MKDIVQISHKVCMTVDEAAEYSSIGQNKLRELCKNPRNKFVLYVGAKTLIKRKEFEEYIARTSEL